jgi:hypothetical protein
MKGFVREGGRFLRMRDRFKRSHLHCALRICFHSPRFTKRLRVSRRTNLLVKRSSLGLMYFS